MMPPSVSRSAAALSIAASICFSASGSEQPISLSRARAKAVGAAVVGLRLDVADGEHPAEHADAEQSEQTLGDRAHRDARGGLARRGALEHVAHVVEVVLHDAREIGVTGPRQLHLAAAASGDLGQLLLA